MLEQAKIAAQQAQINDHNVVNQVSDAVPAAGITSPTQE
jgi:hypothetical protein